MTPCSNCKKEIEGEAIKVEPNRHACSPNSINWMAKKEEDKYYSQYCSNECMKEGQALNYAFWAELDRNASDSECFEHTGWEKTKLCTYRLGKCKITGAEVRVEPLMPGDNSGQPKECYEHFVLKKKYQDLINV